MKVKPNCVNCGAPLHGCKCEYCGTEYDFDDIIKVKYERCEIPLETISCKSIVPLEHIQGCNGMENYIKEDMARQMSKEILKYAEFETWIDPHKLEQVVGARVKVGVPR